MCVTSFLCVCVLVVMVKRSVLFPPVSRRVKRRLFVYCRQDSGVLEESEEEIGCEGEAEGPFDASKEVMKLGDRCPHCGVLCETNMKLVGILPPPPPPPPPRE